MLKTKREKTLAIVLGSAMGALAMWQVLGSAVLQPFMTLKHDIRSATVRHQELEQQLSVVDRANADIGEYYRRSLPPDPATASVTYQHWLLNRLKDSGITAAVVTPGPATPVEHVGHRIPFSISASASTSQIGAFLDSLEAAVILHRITHLNVTSGGNVSSKTRNMTMGLEAIAMLGADTVRELPVPEVNTGKHSLFAVLSDRDIFQRHVPQPKPDPAAAAAKVAGKPVKPPRRPETIRFIGSVDAGGVWQAWFVNPRSQVDSILEESARLSLGSSELVVLAVEADSVRIRLDGTEQLLALGDVVHESMKVALE